jgi:hypothetical protein
MAFSRAHFTFTLIGYKNYKFRNGTDGSIGFALWRASAEQVSAIYLCTLNYVCFNVNL